MLDLAHEFFDVFCWQIHAKPCKPAAGARCACHFPICYKRKLWKEKRDRSWESENPTQKFTSDIWMPTCFFRRDEMVVSCPQAPKNIWFWEISGGFIYEFSPKSILSCVSTCINEVWAPFTHAIRFLSTWLEASRPKFWFLTFLYILAMNFLSMHFKDDVGVMFFCFFQFSHDMGVCRFWVCLTTPMTSAGTIVCFLVQPHHPNAMPCLLSWLKWHWKAPHALSGSIWASPCRANLPQPPWKRRGCTNKLNSCQANVASYDFGSFWILLVLVCPFRPETVKLYSITMPWHQGCLASPILADNASGCTQFSNAYDLRLRKKNVWINPMPN